MLSQMKWRYGVHRCPINRRLWQWRCPCGKPAPIGVGFGYHSEAIASAAYEAHRANCA